MPTSPAEYVRFYEIEPVRTEGGRHWYARGQHFVCVYSELDPGARVPSEDGTNEHFMLLVDGAIEVWAGEESRAVSRRAAIIVPPGDSEVAAQSEATIVRIYAPPTEALLAKCINNATYDEPHHNLAPFAVWPEPVGGYRLRVYEYEDFQDEADFLRSRNIAVQWSPPRGPQGTDQVLPLVHQDFEHTFLCTRGDYVHHMQYPWGRSLADWRPEEHVPIGTPSFTIIPAQVVHVPERAGALNEMIDISAPPRPDLPISGRVHRGNAKEYPLDPAVAATAQERHG